MTSYTAWNPVNSHNILVWKSFGNAQFPQSCAYCGFPQNFEITWNFVILRSGMTWLYEVYYHEFCHLYLKNIVINMLLPSWNWPIFQVNSQRFTQLQQKNVSIYHLKALRLYCTICSKYLQKKYFESVWLKDRGLLFQHIKFDFFKWLKQGLIFLSP